MLRLCRISAREPGTAEGTAGEKNSGTRNQIKVLHLRDEDPVKIFGLPDLDPTCNNGYIKLFSS